MLGGACNLRSSQKADRLFDRYPWLGEAKASMHESRESLAPACEGAGTCMRGSFGTRMRLRMSRACGRRKDRRRVATADAKLSSMHPHGSMLGGVRAPTVARAERVPRWGPPDRPGTLHARDLHVCLVRKRTDREQNMTDDLAVVQYEAGPLIRAPNWNHDTPSGTSTSSDSGTARPLGPSERASMVDPPSAQARA